MKYVPNFITSLNLSAGFFAIIFAANGDILTASWLILAAMIFDFLDGFSARLLKAYSAVGKELDSLADLVSFGVAPALIIYKILNELFLFRSPFSASSDSLRLAIMLIIPAIMTVCAALRLAIFNLDSTQATSFKGLPTPANAIAVIAVVLSIVYSHSPVLISFIRSPAFLVIYTIVLSLLMVSKIPLLSLKFSNLKIKGNEGRYILIALVLPTFAITGISAVILIIPLYIIASLLSLLLFRN